MINELRHWWKIVKAALLAVGILLSFFAIIEILRIYNILRDTYPPIGYAFLLFIVAGLVVFICYIISAMRKLPKVLNPPDIVDLSNASLKECHTYCKYLIRYLNRLNANPNLSNEDYSDISSKITILMDIIDSDMEVSKLSERISEIEQGTIEPLLIKLDARAELEVQNCVRDIMLGVTISPFRSADLFIVVYRNFGMIVRLINIYNSRPPYAEQFLIARDVLGIVATINYLNYGEQLIEKFFSFMPWIGKSIDDFAQGFGAGLLTSVAGHGTIERCRSYKGFSQKLAKQKLTQDFFVFVKDVKNIFMKDVLEKAKGIIHSIAPVDKVGDPLFWQKTKDGISAAIDTVDLKTHIIIREPLVSGTRKTIKGGSNILQKSRRTFFHTGNYIQKGFKATSSGISKGVRFSGRKISSIVKKEKREG